MGDVARRSPMRVNIREGHKVSTRPAPVGMRSRASRRRLSDNNIRCSAFDRGCFRRVRRSTFAEGAIMERAEYHRTRERAWQKRQKTRRDMRHRTRRSASTIGGAARETIIGPRCCGSRGSASLPRHTAKTRRNAHRRIARPYHCPFGAQTLYPSLTLTRMGSRRMEKQPTGRGPVF